MRRRVAPSDIVWLCSSHYKGIIGRARGFFLPTWDLLAIFCDLPSLNERFRDLPTILLRRGLHCCTRNNIILGPCGMVQYFCWLAVAALFLDVPTPFEKKALCCNIWSRLFCFISIQFIGFVSALFVRVLYGPDLLFHWTKHGIQRENWEQLGPYNNQSLKGVVLVFNHLCWNAAQCLIRSLLILCKM